MEGSRHSVTSADGTRVGLLTAGEGPPLLLVHGGMGCTLAVLDGQGHEAIESAPGLLASQLAGFFGY